MKRLRAVGVELEQYVKLAVGIVGGQFTESFRTVCLCFVYARDDGQKLK